MQVNSLGMGSLLRLKTGGERLNVGLQLVIGNFIK